MVIFTGRVWGKGRMAGCVNILCVSCVDMPKNQEFVEEIQPVKDKRFRARK